MSKINNYRILHFESEIGERERRHCALLQRGYSGYEYAVTGADALSIGIAKYLIKDTPDVYERGLPAGIGGHHRGAGK